MLNYEQESGEEVSFLDLMCWSSGTILFGA